MDGEFVGGVYAEARLDTGPLDREMERLQKQLVQAGEDMQDLVRRFKAGEIGVEEFAAAASGLTARSLAAEAGLGRLQGETARFAAAARDAAAATAQFQTSMVGATAAVERGSARSAASLAVVGQTLDDLQYVPEQGLRPIINNLMQISPIAGIAALAIDLLARHSDKLADAFGVGATKTEAERMELLEAKTRRTADETQRLNKFKREQAEIEDLLARRTREQQDTKGAVAEAIAESGDDKATGGERIAQGLAESRNPKGFEGKLTDADKAAIDKARDDARRLQIQGFRGADPGAAAEEVRKKALDRIKAEEKQRAINDVRDATEDPLALQALIREAEQNPAAFPEGLAGRLRAASPEGRKAADEHERQTEREIQASEQDQKDHRDRRRRKNRAATDRERETDDLNRMGQDVERDFRKDNEDDAEKSRKAKDKDFVHRAQAQAADNAAAARQFAPAFRDQAFAQFGARGDSNGSMDAIKAMVQQALRGQGMNGQQASAVAARIALGLRDDYRAATLKKRLNGPAAKGKAGRKVAASGAPAPRKGLLPPAGGQLARALKPVADETAEGSKDQLRALEKIASLTEDGNSKLDRLARGVPAIVT